MSDQQRRLRSNHKEHLMHINILGISFEWEPPPPFYPIHAELLNRHVAQLAREHYNRRVPSAQELQHFIDTTPLQRTGRLRHGYIGKTARIIEDELVAKGQPIDSKETMKQAQEKIKRQTQLALMGLLS